MDQVHVIRHKVLVEGRSVRSVARELGLSRNTVARYLDLSTPARVEKSPRPRPRWSEAEPEFRALLESSTQWTGGKQRLTAARLHEMLLSKGLEVGYTTVKEAYAEWRRQRREVFVPLTYHPGELAQVDFFEVLVDVAGERKKTFMFVMRLMYSGRDFAWLYDRQDQVCFLDGHVRAFAHFGAVPQRIAYDNLKPAVKRILIGQERLLTDRFKALASHYLFEPVFCRPGEGHDKGGVESRGRAIRHQHLVPIPIGEDLASISTRLLEAIELRAQTQSRHDGRSIAECFTDEVRRMLPLPAHVFDARATRIAVASPRAMVKVEGAHYSVPCRWHGLDVTVHIGPSSVDIVGPSGAVSHPRMGFGQRMVDYRHYLPELAKKPQAVRQVAAELAKDLGEPFGQAWRLLVDEAGPVRAARVFAEVLGHIAERGADEVARVLVRAIEEEQPMLLALAPMPAPKGTPTELPSTLRDIQVTGGLAADYDGWLLGGER